jgi:hypothetical protein
MEQKEQTYKKHFLLDHNNIVDFDDLAGEIKPFDLIAFCGADLISDTIGSVQKYYLGTDEFTHVSMVVTADILPFFIFEEKTIYLDPKTIYILESTIPYSLTNFEAVPDKFSGKSQMGVQLRNLKDVTRLYLRDKGSRVCWCKLLNNPFDNVSNRPSIAENFNKIFGQYYGRMYDASVVSLSASIFPIMRSIRTMRDFFYYKLYSILKWVGFVQGNKGGPAEWQFCSELVANIYINFAIIPESFNPKDVVPADFFGFDKDGLSVIVGEPRFIFVTSEA